MGGDKKAIFEEADPQLHCAFKKLRVDPHWNPSQSSANVDNLRDFWTRDISHVANQPSNKSGKAKKHCVKKIASNSGRMEPYQRDFLCSMEKLSFHSEVCQKRSCTCGDLRVKSVKKFNYANSSLQHRPLIREARFKLHHSEKDCKQVIRAARLKIFKRSNALHSKVNTKGSSWIKSKTLCIANESACPNQTFGATGKEHLDFKSLISDNELLKVKSTGEVNNSASFKSYRLQSDSANNITTQTDLNTPESAGNGLDLDLTCSQQARLDDMSVNELAGYFDDFVHIPKKMSSMAEMMYT